MEREAEEKRKSEFAAEYCALNKIPILGQAIKSAYKEGFRYSLGLLIILSLTATLLFYKLGQRDFWEDEHQVVSAATGYLFTGDFYRWNWIRDDASCFDETAKCRYDRAWPHSFLIAQSYKIFGISEWSSRFVSAIFGILLVFLSYAFAKFFTEDKRIALIAAFLFSINPSYINISRYTRMYALLIPLFLLAAYAFFKGITGETRFSSTKFKKIKELIGENFNYNFPYLLGGFFLLPLIYHIHINGLIIMPILLIFVCYMAVLSRKNKYIAATLLGIIGLEIASIMTIFSPALNKITGFLSFFQKNNLIYLNYLTEYPFPGKMGIIILFLGLISLAYASNKTIKEKLAYLYIVVGFSLVFFIYIADRYASFVYVSHITTISLLLIIYFYLFAALKLKSRLIKYFMIAFLILSSAQSLFLDWGKLYDNDYDLGRLSAAYKTISDNIDTENDTLFGQYLRDYYLDNVDSNVRIISMLNNEEYSFEMFLADINRQKSGWITWESKKSYHIKNEIRDYIDDNFQKFNGQGVDDTNVEVYYFDKTMIPANASPI